MPDRIALDGPDGYWGRTPMERLRMTRTLAGADMVWLEPYLPWYARTPTGFGGWDTTVTAVIRASALSALRRHFRDPAHGAPRDCRSYRLLALVDAWKDHDPSVRWADTNDVTLWPVAWRVDAARLEARFAEAARMTWCRWCDAEPAANAAGSCLWCERQGDYQ